MFNKITFPGGVNLESENCRYTCKLQSSKSIKSIIVFKQDKIPGYSTVKKNCNIQGKLPEKKICMYVCMYVCNHVNLYLNTGNHQLSLY